MEGTYSDLIYKPDNKMRHINFTEDKIYTFSELLARGLDHYTLVHLQKNKIIEKNNDEFQFRFIGSIFKNENHFLIYPKYRKTLLNDDEIKIFHNCLIKFNNTLSLYQNDLAGNWRDVYDVLNDFNRNGYFTSYQKALIRDWSNPNWDKIFNKQVYAIDNMLMDEPISSTTTITQDRLKEMHTQIIYFLFKKFPVMHTFFPYIKISKPPIIIEPHILSFKIQSEIQKNSFSREARMLKKAFNIINEVNSEGLIIGTKNTHVFFEQLCKSYLKDTSYKWIQHFPRAQWQIKERSGKTYPHKPDIIKESGNTILLYDAKYYDTVKHQPGIQDITKQILYEKCLKSVNDNLIVENGFIFPSDNPNDHYSNVSGKIEYDIFGSNTIINTHHQYDIELFKHY